MKNFLTKYLQLRNFRKHNDTIVFKEKIWSQLKPVLLRENKIEQERKEIINERNKIKLPSWGKMLLVFLFINFTALEIFIGWVTVQSFALAFALGGMIDFTPLVTLIGLVAGETISYGAYCAKSKAENIEGGIVFETAMHNLQKEEEDAKG